MLATKLLASSALALSLLSTAGATAFADETVTSNGVLNMDTIKIKGRRQHPGVSVAINALVTRAPLPELRQPLVDRIGKAVESSPF